MNIKYFLVILMLFPLLVMCNGKAKNAQTAENTTADFDTVAQITFQVEELSKPEKLLKMQQSSDVYKNLILIGENMYDIKSHKDFPYNIVAYSELPDSLIMFGNKSFFDGICAAYTSHRPVVLSPDMIWLLVSQGFAQHVNANSESLRHYFVDFKGKQSLIVNSRNDYSKLDTQDWEKAFSQFSGQIAKNVGYELVDVLTCDFSTTTAVEKTVSEITIMEAFKSYFEYIMEYGCGIPQITLEGTPDDWQKVLDKTQRLAKYDLKWWTSELEPILKQFVEASKGNVDKPFWQKLFKIHTQKLSNDSIEEDIYASDVIDGWIVKFFPYDKDGNKNDLQTLPDNTNLPDEIVKVDLKFAYIDPVSGKTTETPLELWAGFVGLEQNKKNFALRPKIAWMVRKKDRENSELQRKIEEERGLYIRVKEFPEALLSIPYIEFLYIDFINKINIPEEFATTKIDNLTLNGNITQEETARIIKMFPHTNIEINAKTVNEIKLKQNNE